jgi:antirepressor protein
LSCPGPRCSWLGNCGTARTGHIKQFPQFPRKKFAVTEIVKVPFRGDEILTVDVGGVPHVVLRPVLERLGLDYSGQLQRLKRKSWASMGMTPMEGYGYSRQTVTVDVRTLLMLLATIDETRVAEHVRPTLVAYQQEVAAAIESYWTRGGAINPRASQDQLTAIVSRAEAQMRVLQMANGLVDSRWLEAKTRHTIARALGEEPEIQADSRPLTVGEFLQEQGVNGSALRSMASGFGKRLKSLYRERYGQDPPITERFVDGALRPVAGYTEADRPLFDEVFSKPFGTASRGA